MSITSPESEHILRKPVIMSILTKEDLDAEIAKGMDDIESGRVHSTEEMRKIQLTDKNA